MSRQPGSLLILSGLILLGLLFPLPAASVPADAVISNCANDTQLRNAVSAGGMITFNCGTATIPLTGRMEVTTDTVIDGADKITLDGAGTSAFFQVFSEKQLTLRNLILRNGRYANGHPLEIFGVARLEGVTVTKSQTGSNGGAVKVYDRLIVKDSRFTDNTAASSGATVATGAAILIEGGTVSVENSTFTNNSIGGNFGLGGAIYVNGGSLTISNSSFSSNYAFDGGAINLNSGTRVTVTHSIFAGNSARYGGAIESNGELQLDYSTLRNNKALSGDGGALWVLNSDADITYSSFSNNQAQTTGGAISCYATTLSIIHSTVSGNRVTGNMTETKGGGIYSICNLNLTNSTLSGNQASNRGGGLYQEGASTATIVHATIFSNTASFGAGIYNESSGGTSTLTLEKTLLANNSTGSCAGTITSLGYNLSSDSNCSGLNQTGDQQNVSLPLGSLSDNGGATQTHLPLANNPAIDAIPTASCGFDRDQRDITRPQSALCDIGAVEVVALKNVYLPLVEK